MLRTLKNVGAIFLLCTVFTTLFLAEHRSPEIQNIDPDQRSVQNEMLIQTAISEGKVKIIAKLWVPGITKLTEDSTKYPAVLPGQEFAWGGILADVLLKDEISYIAGSVLEYLSGTDFKVNHIYSSIPYMALDVSPEALILLESFPEVLSINEDRRDSLIDPLEEYSNSAMGLAKNLETNSQLLNNTVSIVGADDAWDLGYTGSAWYVAVLDTGIRRSHSFFQGKNIVEACFAQGEWGFGDCPNGSTAMIGVGAAVHYSSIYPSWDHGTHVAGIAAGNNGSLFGIAKDANIIAVQVFSGIADCDSGTVGDQPCVTAWHSDLIAALEYVYSIRGTYGIASVNMSLGGGMYSSSCDTDARKAVIDNLRAVGIASVIATGNNAYCNAISAPACISSSIAVGGSTDGDTEYNNNNWHPTLQKLFAPGVSVYSSTGDSNTSYESWSGTSMATPHVAGAWAILRQANPVATVAEILSALQNTGFSVYSVCDGYVAPIPRIQIDAALLSLVSPEIPKNPIPSHEATGVSLDANLNWDDSEFADSYDVYFGSTYPPPFVTNIAASVYEPGTLVSDTEYYWRIVAKNSHSFTSGPEWSFTTEGAIVQHTLTATASPGAGGSVTKNPDLVEYDYNTVVSVTATPSPGYTFTGWSGDATGTANPVNVTMDANKTVTANFTINTYTLAISVSPEASGSVTKNPDLSNYDHDTVVQLTPVPATGYTFTGWSGDATGSDNPLNMTMDANKSFTANFTLNIYTLTVAADPVAGGSVTKVPDQTTFNAGETVQLTAAAATGYTFTGWGGDVTGMTNPVNVTMDTNKSVTAYFALDNYYLNTLASPDVGGSVTRNPDQPRYDHGTVVQITAVPPTGYTFTGWSGDATGSTNPLNLTMDSNKTVTANFSLNTYTLTATASPGAGGSVARNPDQPNYDHGTMVQLTAAPATGYAFTGWSGDATGATNPVDVTMDGNKSVTANFSLNAYTLTATASPVAGGSITKTPDQGTYDHGTVVQLTAAPATGYTFTEWSGDTTGTQNPLSIMMDGPKNIMANFSIVIIQYDLSISASSGGTTSPTPGSYSYDSGTTVEINALPETEAGFIFSNWTGDISSGQENNNPISLSMTSNKSIMANFSKPSAEITLSTSSLNFGGSTSGETTSAQQLYITNTGTGTLDWSITDNRNWLSCSPTSATGDAEVNVTVDSSSLVAGTYNGQITVSSGNASNSPQYINVSFRVYSTSADSAPFGKFETPTNGATVSGNIPVTGWALDDIEVIKVEIKRDSHALDPPGAIGPDGLVYIGDANLVKGARPDVAAAYPYYPLCERAGWGYMMLTNFLPNGGNGNFTIYAIAFDNTGHRVQLGTKEIICDNANRVEPFGTIDTPGQGGMASGAAFLNWGWALTPPPKKIPEDGSTIWAWVDGVPLGHPSYNHYRADIATLFPGYLNSNGAVGYYLLDTTAYENGVHNIAWSVTDDQGAADGIGSRYFEVQNLGGSAALLGKQRFLSLNEDSTGSLKISAWLKERGYGYTSEVRSKAVPSRTTRELGDSEGPLVIEIEELERIVVELKGKGGTRFVGWGMDETKELPIGSTLDSEKGLFYWIPGPGFLGKHILHFAVTDGINRSKPITVDVNIVPKKYIINN